MCCNPIYNLNDTVVGLFVILGWTVSCYIKTQVFWIKELGPVQLQFTLVPFAETSVTYSWQAKLLQEGYGRHIQYDNKGNMLPVKQNK